MRVRILDKKGDWTFGQSQSNYAKNISAVALDIKMKLREWYQDCFFNLEAGIPWDVRLGSHNQKELLDEDIQQVVMSVEGVLNIFDFKSSVEDRRCRCQMNVYTQFSGEYLPISFNSEDI